MSKEITGVSELLKTLSDSSPSKPGRRSFDHTDSMFGLKAPNWGPPASLDAGDVASRLGIDMGEPTVKAAALRHALLYDEEAALEKLAVMPLVARGARAVASGAKKLFGGIRQAGNRSRQHFAARRTSDIAEKRQKAQARRAAHKQNIQGLTGAQRTTENLKFHGQEAGRKAVGTGVTGVGLSWSASDLKQPVRDARLGGRGAIGHGG